MIVRVTAGNGGKEAQSWAATLALMYMTWAEQNIDVSAPETALFHDDTCLFRGHVPAWTFKNEAGIHRFVRNSPFDPEHRRTTTFAFVTLDGAGLESDVVRSYILDPYTRAVDHRTGRETPDVAAVLAGDLTALLPEDGTP